MSASDEQSPNSPPTGTNSSCPFRPHLESAVRDTFGEAIALVAAGHSPRDVVNYLNRCEGAGTAPPSALLTEADLNIMVARFAASACGISDSDIENAARIHLPVNRNLLSDDNGSDTSFNSNNSHDTVMSHLLILVLIILAFGTGYLLVSLVGCYQVLHRLPRDIFPIY